MNFVCFGCRVSHSQTYIEDVSTAPRLCPTGGKAMIYTTPSYEPPSRTNLKAWELDRRLAEARMLAHSPRYAHGVSPDMKISTLRQFEQIRRLR